VELQRAQNSITHVVNLLCRLSTRIISDHTSETALATYRSDTKLTSKWQQQHTKFDNWLSSILGIICCRVGLCTYTQQLRSSSSLLLQLPSTRTVMARRAFSQAAPRVWNDLPIVLWHLIVLDPLYTLIIISLLLTITDSSTPSIHHSLSDIMEHKQLFAIIIKIELTTY